MDMEEQELRLLRTFVAQLRRLWAQQTANAVRATLSRPYGPDDSTPADDVSVPRAAQAQPERAWGEKRTPEHLDALADAFVDCVTQNPGQRIEQLNRIMSTHTSDLALPIRKLLSEPNPRIFAIGEKRATRYFPTGHQFVSSTWPDSRTFALEVGVAHRTVLTWCERGRVDAFRTPKGYRINDASEKTKAWVASASERREQMRQLALRQKETP